MSNPKYANIGDPEDKVVEELSELIAECTNLIKEICKARRFGYFNYHPDEPPKMNIDRIKGEMSDCVESFERLEVKLRMVQYDHFRESNLRREP